jgi:uncharacterized membrane protein YqaE (UPF0057 family)
MSRSGTIRYYPGDVIKRNGRTPMNVIRIILAIFLPPIAAFLTVGIGLHFWLNILLTICGVVPGMIHALWLVLKNATDPE